MNVAKDAPTECLVEHEEKNDSFETNPCRQKVTIAPLQKALPGKPIQAIEYQNDSSQRKRL
jgi:hypothetical protein